MWFPISLGSTSLIFDALISLWDGRNFFVLWNVEELREETPRPLVVRIKVDWCTGWWVFVNIATNFSPVFFKVTINWGLWLWVLFGNNMCGIGTQVKSESAPNNHGIYRRGPFFRIHPLPLFLSDQKSSRGNWSTPSFLVPLSTFFSRLKQNLQPWTRVARSWLSRIFKSELR